MLNVIASKEILLLGPLVHGTFELPQPNSFFYHFRAFGLYKTMTPGSGGFVVPPLSRPHARLEAPIFVRRRGGFRTSRVQGAVPRAIFPRKNQSKIDFRELPLASPPALAVPMPLLGSSGRFHATSNTQTTQGPFGKTVLGPPAGAPEHGMCAFNRACQQQ